MRTIRAGTRSPWVIAHRGSSVSCPENTAAAFDAALAEGCDGIELDVQLSADGIPFVYHDRTLSRIGSGRRAASSLSMAELRELDAGSWWAPRFSDQRLLSLEDLLARYASRTFLLIELKTYPRDAAAGGPGALAGAALAHAVTSVLLEQRVEKRVALLGFDLETLEAARARAPRIRAALNLRARGRLPASARRALAGLWALSLDLRSLTPSVVREAHERRMPVLTWTCNTERQLRKALACGADAIMSDQPAWLREALSLAVPR